VSASRIAALTLLISALCHTGARAEQFPGAGTDNPGTGGQAQISTWVIGAINGGVARPTGTTSCTAWALVDGSNFDSIGLGDPTVINPATGEPSTVFFRICDGTYQFVYVGPHSPADIARVAYQRVAALVPRPEASFSPPIDKMIVNFETWLGITPRPPVTATAAIPGLSATVTAQPSGIEWTTGSRVAGDTTLITCQPWGSTTFAAGGCAWTPAYPSVGKVTGTTDLRYHGTVTIVWHVTWEATNGATGTLGDLRTTTPIEMGVQEIQTIGGP
jgi:hypothetical protein